MRVALLLLLALVLAGCAAPDPDGPTVTTPDIPTGTNGYGTSIPTPNASTPTPRGAPRIALEPFLDELAAPLLLTYDPTGAKGELFVVEQSGRIWRINGTERALWLDISDQVSDGGEQGLLGLAFPPTQNESARVAYISYTEKDGDSVLSRIRYDEREADAETEDVLLNVDQPYSNHNGGHILFGPDGLLWYDLGDGGSSGDPQGNGQDHEEILASLLRLDVSLPKPEPEIWAKGLRNPWRFTFDRATNDLYIADVGQNKIEEVNFVPAGAPKGLNFGWAIYEGTDRYKLFGETSSEHTPPVAEYTHAEGGCSVTGGHVYRGEREPPLVGYYFFADYCSGKIWALWREAGEWRHELLTDTALNVSSFGEDAEGEVYVVSRGGTIHRLTAAE